MIAPICADDCADTALVPPTTYTWVAPSAVSSADVTEGSCRGSVNKIGPSTIPARYDAANASGKDTPLATTAERDVAGNAVLRDRCRRRITVRALHPHKSPRTNGRSGAAADANRHSGRAAEDRDHRSAASNPHNKSPIGKTPVRDHLLCPRRWVENLNGKRVTPVRRSSSPPTIPDLTAHICRRNARSFGLTGRVRRGYNSTSAYATSGGDGRAARTWLSVAV